MNDEQRERLGAHRAFWWILDALLVVLILVGFAGARFLREEAATLPGRTITVSAEGKALAVPDIAQLSFSAVSEGKDPKALQDENTVRMNQAIEFVRSEGVPAKDIKTTGYALSPRYDYDRFSGKSSIFGYSLTQTVSVKIRDFAHIGSILGELPRRGINQIESFNFAVDDPEKHLTEARREAFLNAREKAEAMAGANGVRIARVVTFSESGGGFPPPYLAMERGAAVDAQAAPLPRVEPGSQELKVQVSITYEIR